MMKPKLLHIALVLSSSAAWQHGKLHLKTPSSRLSRLRTRASPVEPTGTEVASAQPSPPPSPPPVQAVAKEKGSDNNSDSDEWDSFRWRENWYPLAFTKTTDKKVPTRVELFGEPVVLWFDHVEQRWAAVLDKCPHRLAPLSEGRVDEQGQIECVSVW
jgi:pheophorbide a oxygenase